MTKSNHYQRIESFMNLAGQEVPATPQIPSKEVRLLRAKLILEEALETIKALGISVTHAVAELSELDIHELNFEAEYEPNLLEIADGCADLSVVTIGTLISCGIHDTELLEEVDKSNLAKFEVPRCPLHGDTMSNQHEESQDLFRCWKIVYGHDTICNYTAHGGYRRADGKWIKPPDWKKPDIQRIIDAQTKCVEMHDGEE